MSLKHANLVWPCAKTLKKKLHPHCKFIVFIESHINPYILFLLTIFFTFEQCWSDGRKLKKKKKRYFGHIKRHGIYINAVLAELKVIDRNVKVFQDTNVEVLQKGQ